MLFGKYLVLTKHIQYSMDIAFKLKKKFRQIFYMNFFSNTFVHTIVSGFFFGKIRNRTSSEHSLNSENILMPF